MYCRSMLMMHTPRNSNNKLCVCFVCERCRQRRVLSARDHYYCCRTTSALQQRERARGGSRAAPRKPRRCGTRQSEKLCVALTAGSCVTIAKSQNQPTSPHPTTYPKNQKLGGVVRRSASSTRILSRDHAPRRQGLCVSPLQAVDHTFDIPAKVDVRRLHTLRAPKGGERSGRCHAQRVAWGARSLAGECNMVREALFRLKYNGRRREQSVSGCVRCWCGVCTIVDRSQRRLAASAHARTSKRESFTVIDRKRRTVVVVPFQYCSVFGVKLRKLAHQKKNLVQNRVRKIAARCPRTFGAAFA